MKLVPPYVTRDVVITLEKKGSQIDEVERAGYVSPDKKIQSFIESGQLLQDYRGNSEEFDIEGSESDFESDSPEYADELTHDAENYSGEIMPQFIDKITANEIVAEYGNKQEMNDVERFKAESYKKAKQSEDDSLLAKLSDSVAKEILKKTADAEPKGKSAAG